MFDVIKYHATENGETSSAAKYDSMDDALHNYHQFAANYMADTTVLAWSLAIVECNAGVDMRMIKRDSYQRVVAVADEEPVEG